MRSDQRRDFFVVTGTDRPDVLVVGARLEGEDLVTVRELDLRTLRYGPPLFQRAGRDAEDGLVDEQGRLVAAKYLDDRVAWAPADKALSGHLRAMDDFFDRQANVHLFDVDATHTRFLALVRGPREPGSFYLYDKGAKKIEGLGSSYPNLDPERLGEMETLRVKTRDGASIDAYLTAPVGRAPGPLVVLAHGGPEVRDSYDWDRQAQVLAAQGWWVLQPNFRGSGGYGRAFAEAGWRRWGDRMQEDVEDAVAHAVALRKLDPARVAIMGTSYGGYAALMGAARRPDLYKAAISICGVSDLPEMLAWERREDETGDKWLYRHWVERIGDPRTDMARLEAASPRRVAAKLTMPVMLVHGEQDAVVPIDQSRMMHRALRGAGGTVEFREIARAGHADWEDEVEQELVERYVRLIGGAFKA
jgi:dipeptidyl aminopeptidase/acylaminoacyl peptidase